VGLVIEASGNPRDPFGQAALSGLRRAVRELGIEAKVLQPSPKEGYFSSFLYLARRGFGLVLGASALESGVMYRAALEFPKTRFAIIDQAIELLPSRPANLEGSSSPPKRPATSQAAWSSAAPGRTSSAPSAAASFHRSTGSLPATGPAPGRPTRGSRH